MKRQIMLLSACTVALLSACSSNTRITNEVYAPAAKNELRAPATPLVTIDPYTSAWSFADRLIISFFSGIHIFVTAPAPTANMLWHSSIIKIL